jgi:glucose dehydrogenase
MTVGLADGTRLEGTTTARPGADEVQLRGADGRIYLLRKHGEGYRRVTSEVDWPTYDGVMGGNRYTTLTQIDKTSVRRLAPKWVFTYGGRSR